MKMSVPYLRDAGGLLDLREYFLAMQEEAAKVQEAPSAEEKLRKDFRDALCALFPNSWELSNRGTQVQDALMAVLKRHGWVAPEQVPTEEAPRVRLPSTEGFELAIGIKRPDPK